MQIIRPTEKIRVIESKKQCKTGSIGYLAYQQPMDMYNIYRSLIVFTKFGNKGKNRIEMIGITTEMVDINSMKATPKQRESLKERITKSSIMPRHPDKYYTINSSIERVPMTSKSVIDLDIWNFFGYICSLSLFMKSLTGGDTRLPLPGRDGPSIADVNRTRIIDVPPIALANYIYLALNYSELAGVDAEEISSRYMDHFNNTRNRTKCMDKMYLLLSTLREGVLRYSTYIIEAHKNMTNRIKSIIANKRESPIKFEIGIDVDRLEVERPGRPGRPRSVRAEAVPQGYRSPGEPVERRPIDANGEYRTMSSTSSASRPLRTTNPVRTANPRPERSDIGTWEMRREAQVEEEHEEEV